MEYIILGVIIIVLIIIFMKHKPKQKKRFNLYEEYRRDHPRTEKKNHNEKK